MKRCPTCNRTFDEDWLAFCTDDGGTLIEMPSAPLSNEPPPTAFIPPAVNTNPGAPKPFDLPGSYNPPQPVAPAWQLGIFSFTIGWCCSIGLLSAPVGIVLGIISLVQIKNDPAANTGKPLSIIGVCLSGFYIVVWFLIFMLYGMAIFMGSLSQ